jgi:hypothetical protein
MIYFGHAFYIRRSIWPKSTTEGNNSLEIKEFHENRRNINIILYQGVCNCSFPPRIHIIDPILLKVERYDIISNKFRINEFGLNRRSGINIM